MSMVPFPLFGVADDGSDSLCANWPLLLVFAGVFFEIRMCSEGVRRDCQSQQVVTKSPLPLKCVSCRYAEWVSGYGCWIRLHFDRPVSFSRRLFFSLSLFYLFLGPFFFLPSCDGVTGSNWLIVPLFSSVNKNKNKKIGRTMPNTESIIRREGTSACQSLICVRCPCARARVLSRFLGTSGILVSLVFRVSFVSRHCRNKEHIASISDIIQPDLFDHFAMKS